MSEATGQLIRVLLVEDDPDDYECIREMLAQISNGRRYQLDWVTHSETALQLLAGKSHDVCLLDYYLGAEHGLAMLERARSAGVSVPMILLTGSGSGGLEQLTLAAGAADYLIKGQIDARVLERSIRHSLERGRNIEALRERESQLRAMFEAALDPMLIADDAARFVDGNGAALALLAVTRAELCSTTFFDLAVPEERERARATWETLLRQGRLERECQLRRSDGVLRLVEVRATARFSMGRHLCVLRDVTERRAAEAYRLRLASLVDSAADAIEGIGLDGRIDYWSPAAERMYGYSSNEAIGLPKRQFMPDDKSAEFEEVLARVSRGESVRTFETVRRRKDGTTFPASVTMSPLIHEGQMVAMSVITRDITEQKTLEEHLAVSDRMASMGTLAAGVAHEINNPLAAVIANLEFVDSELDGLERRAALRRSTSAEDDLAGLGDELRRLREPLAEARAAADRIRHVTRDLKLFSKPDELKRGPVDVRTLLESSVRLAWNEIRHRARLVRQFDDIPPVHANEARLGQVFLNLLVNAAQAIPPGAAEANEIGVVARLGENGTVVAEVRDTGSGMAPETVKRIFEPFFTTKPVGVGTGLGLPICRRIVHEFGGEIAVMSAPGRGSTFRVTLPACPVDVAFVETASPSRGLGLQARRRGRVLVIDDEPLIGSALRRTLADEHDVSCMSCAASALEHLRGAREPYDVILCDMMMPQMTGMELYDTLVRELPASAQRVVFLTGGAFTPAAREFLERVPNLRLQKPFDPSQLRNLIGDCVRRHDSEVSMDERAALGRAPRSAADQAATGA